MNSFYDLPVVSTAKLFREARISPTRGNRVVDRLAAQGLVNPVKTPTGRRDLTPKDGAIVFDELMAA